MYHTLHRIIRRNLFIIRNPLEKKKRLLFHNEDDLIGTIVCALLLAYTTSRPISTSAATKPTALYRHLRKKCRQNISFQKGDISFSFEGKSISIEGATLGRYAVPLFLPTIKIIIICQKKIWRYIKALAVLSNLPTVRKQLPLTATSKKTADFFRYRLAPTGILLFFRSPEKTRKFLYHGKKIRN